jgi:hypothetical protein
MDQSAMEQLMVFMKTHIGSLASEMNAIKHKMLAKMDAWRGVTPACLEEEEPAPEDTEVIAKSQEVPKGATEEEAIGVTEDRSRNLRLAAGCRGRLKTRTKGDDRVRQVYAATIGWLTCRFVPALSKGGLRKGPGRMWRHSCIGGRSKASRNGVREMIGKQRQLLERKKTHSEAIRQKLDVKIAKLIFESSVRYRKMGDWLL